MRTEILLARPGLIGATGETRAAVLELRAEDEAALADADARLRAAATDRLAAVDRIRRANRALVGTGQIVDRRTGELVQHLRRRSDAVRDPLPKGPFDVIAGEELRLVLVDLLRVVTRPARVSELVRLLAVHGFAAPGRGSHTVSNALLVETRAGRVRHVARGVYEAS